MIVTSDDVIHVRGQLVAPLAVLVSRGALVAVSPKDSRPYPLPVLREPGSSVGTSPLGQAITP
ncbi:hypothetical protein [Streptomyces sp. NPDC006879]|uniref:hypothetical protein n=1 Tax=Streptomyces sp. NPDC006879 TaxID=3364767 RepID=UPI0036A66504